MSGDGNYTAQGMLASSAVETTSLNESQTLSLANVANIDGVPVTPIYRNEIVKFKYPMTYTQWAYINQDNHKYGKVKYSVNGGNDEYGYIQEIKYNLFEGMAEFVLKPAIS
jgi:hypothetical protein